MIEFRVVALVIFLLLSGCSVGDRPDAHLSFSKFYQSEARYAIEFYSDRDIDRLFFPEKGEKTVSRSLICALEKDQDFRVEHSLAKLFDGGLNLEGREGVQRYKYSSAGNFFLTWDGDARRRTLDSREVLKLLEDKQEINCKVVVTVYLHRPYYSQVMKIPVSALVNVLKQVQPPKSCCNVQDAFTRRQ